MSERYIRVGYSDIELYNDNAPVIVEKSAILFDSSKGMNLLQLKFQNIQEKVIKCLEIRIVVSQIETNETNEYSHIYFELTAEMNMYFGQNDAIYIQEKEGAKCAFDVYINRIVYADGSSIQENLRLCPIRKPESIGRLGNLSQTFARTVKENGSCKEIKFMPQKINDGWRCSCGCINHRNNVICRSCGIEKDFLFETVSDNDFLHSKMNEYQEKDRVAQSKEKQRKKLKRRIALGICIIVVITIGLPMGISVIDRSNSDSFLKASEYARVGELEKADEVLDSVWFPSKAIKNLEKAINEAEKLMKEKPAGVYILIEAIDENTKEKVICYNDTIQIRYIVSNLNPARIVDGGEKWKSLYWNNGEKRISRTSPFYEYGYESPLAGAKISIKDDEYIIIKDSNHSKTIKYVFKWEKFAEEF